MNLRLKNFALVLAGAFLFALPQSARAQFTTVTATVTDPNGIPYAGGVMNAILVPGASGGYTLGGQPYAGRVGPVTLDSTGKFTAQFGDVTLISPGSPQWQITIDSASATVQPPVGTGPQSFSYTTTGTMISGGSLVNLTAALSGVAPRLTNFAVGTAAPALINQFTDLFNRSSFGSNWNQAIGTWTTSASGPVTTGSGFSVAQYTANGAADSEDVIVTVPGTAITSGYAGIYLRSACSAGMCSGYGFVENTNTLYLAKFVGTTSGGAGTITIYNGGGAGTTITANAFDQLELKVTGGVGGTGAQLQAYWNRTALTFESVDTSTPLTGGFPALLTNGTNSINAFNYIAPAPSTAAINIVVQGESTCEGAGIYTRWSNFIATSLKNAYVTNVCVSTQGLGTVFAAATSGNLNTGLQDGTNVVDPLLISGSKNIAVLAEGTNDLGPGAKSPSTVQGYENTWVAARHAAGWKYAIVVPVLSRCDTASYDPTMTAYDILVQQNAAGADAVVPMQQALIGRGSCNDTITFRADKVHPSQFGATSLIGPNVGATVTSLP